MPDGTLWLLWNVAVSLILYTNLLAIFYSLQRPLITSGVIFRLRHSSYHFFTCLMRLRYLILNATFISSQNTCKSAIHIFHSYCIFLSIYPHIFKHGTFVICPFLLTTVLSCVWSSFHSQKHLKIIVQRIGWCSRALTALVVTSKRT